MYSTHNSYMIVLKFVVFQKNFIKFHENPSSRSGIVPCGRKEGQTDEHDEANNGFAQFFESS